MRKTQKLTAAGTRKLCKTKQRIVARDLEEDNISGLSIYVREKKKERRKKKRAHEFAYRLEGDVGVPLETAGLGLVVGALLLAELAVQLAVLHGRDDADFVVPAAAVAPRVDDGVDVQARRRGLARELAESLHQLLLQVVCDVVLLSEEDYAAARDWRGGLRR